MKTRILELRLNNKLKQKEVAEAIGCDRSLLSRYERGERKISLRHLARLADYYNTSIDYLAGLTDDPVPYPKSEKPNR